jgi:transposase InsO family protein
VNYARERGVSERHACLLLGQPRGTQCYRPTQREDEDRLTQAIVALASQYGRYGYRRITALLVHAGWNIEPGSPWENDYCESFNSKLRDEFLNLELFYSMKELRAG